MTRNLTSKFRGREKTGPVSHLNRNEGAHQRFLWKFSRRKVNLLTGWKPRGEVSGRRGWARAQGLHPRPALPSLGLMGGAGIGLAETAIGPVEVPQTDIAMAQVE